MFASIKELTTKWSCSLARLHHEKKGIAAVEFALIAPFMISLYFGSIEISQGVTIDRKVSHASSALADLITQEQRVDDGQLEDIMNASSAIMMPYDAGQLRIVLVGVQIDNDGNATVAWSKGRNATGPAIGATYAVPAGLVIPNTFLVTARLEFDYTPIVGNVITGSITLNDEFFLRPRRSAEIEYEV
jgi:Flp pilus assembly protein TadG